MYLRVMAADADEQRVDEVADGGGRRVNARDDLRDHHQPRVDAHVLEPLLQRALHLRRRAVVEPQRQQPQDVLSGSGAGSGLALGLGLGLAAESNQKTST